MDRELAAVICCWQYDARAKRCWVLKHAYAVDDGGWPLVKQSEEVNSGQRWGYTRWLYRPTNDGPVDIPGRCLTMWTMLDAVQLLGINPPGEQPRWLNTEFADNLKKLPNWSSLLTDGYTLRSGTAEAAKKLFKEGK